MTENNSPIDCACLIHGNTYDWIYVERLHSMLTRNFSRPIRLHVWTEANRSVPSHMIKHELEEWPGIEGPRRAWWYKMQMFNSKTFAGNLCYFDLDVVVVKSLDWMLQCSPHFFWGIRDFRYIWRPTWSGINSSMMYWDTTKFHYVWDKFKNTALATVMRQYAGDQDFISAAIEQNKRQFFEDAYIQSWRWQVNDGGMDPKKRTYRMDNAGAVLDPKTHIVIFHGRPKPHEIQDQAILKYWV